MCVRVSLLGASGKMGKRILKIAANHPSCKIVIGTSRQFPETLTPQKIANVDINMTSCAKLAIFNADIAIDFSSRESTLKHVEYAKQLSKPIVIGTTGHNVDIQKKNRRNGAIYSYILHPQF